MHESGEKAYRESFTSFHENTALSDNDNKIRDTEKIDNIIRIGEQKRRERDEFDAEIDELMIPDEEIRARAKEAVRQREEMLETMRDRVSIVIERCRLGSLKIYASTDFTETQKIEFSDLWSKLIKSYEKLENIISNPLLDEDNLDKLKIELEELWKFDIFADDFEQVSYGLKEYGSSATIDSNFEGGMIKLEISPELKEKLNNPQTAKTAYKNADNSSPSEWFDRDSREGSDLDNGRFWESIEHSSFDILVLSPGNTEVAGLRRLGRQMSQIGYRNVTLAELVAIGIERPDLNKQKLSLYTFSYRGRSENLETASLSGSANSRCFDSHSFISGQTDGKRLLFTRK